MIIAIFQQIAGPLNIQALLIIAYMNLAASVLNGMHAYTYFPSHASFMYTVLINHFLHPIMMPVSFEHIFNVLF